jgi:hypothetical protein
VGDAKEGSVAVGLARREDAHAVARLFDIDVRRRVGFVGRERELAAAALHRALQVLRHVRLAMQVGDVTGVEIALVGLKIVAFMKILVTRTWRPGARKGS